MGKSNNISNGLKHRIAQMLLSSSCITTSIINISDKTSQEPVFPSSNRRAHHRGKFVHRPHRMAPVVQVSIDCSARRPIHAASPNFPLTTEEEKRNRKKERRVTETGVGEGRKCPPALPSSPSNDHYYSHSKEKAMAEKKDKFVSANKKLFSNGYGYSSSPSIGSNDVFFDFSSSEEEEEAEEEEEEATVSSDSLEFFRQSSYKKTTENKESTRPPPRKGGRHVKDGWDEGNNSQPLISVSSREKKEKLAEARTGFAVVKRSTDPYGDFRSSMVEMIVEGRMSEPEDLERLLHSYLSLNSPCHHPVILEAFADIWEAIFGKL